MERHGPAVRGRCRFRPHPLRIVLDLSRAVRFLREAHVS